MLKYNNIAIPKFGYFNDNMYKTYYFINNIFEKACDFIEQYLRKINKINILFDGINVYLIKIKEITKIAYSINKIKNELQIDNEIQTNEIQTNEIQMNNIDDDIYDDIYDDPLPFQMNGLEELFRAVPKDMLDKSRNDALKVDLNAVDMDKMMDDMNQQLQILFEGINKKKN
jgi:hypothetical protein